MRLDRRAGLGCALISSASVMVGCDDGLQRDCRPADGTPRFGVVMSDFQSTSIGLLDAAGGLLTECWIDSGSRRSGLVAALSGDVVLATDQPAGVLTVIDRLGTDVYSRVALDEPTVLGQVRLQDSSISNAFSANPHDAVAVSETSVWVSRFAGNTDDTAPPAGRGSDLVELDPIAYRLTGDRISLEDFVVPVTVETDSGPTRKLAYPRPSRIVRVGSILIVGLARLTLEFDGAAPGAVAVVDLTAGSAALFELGDEVRNCGRVTPVPGAPNAVAVACVGFSRPFGVPARVRATAGLFLLGVDGTEVSVLRAWRPRNRPTAPLAVHEMVALDDRRFAAVEYGVGEGQDRYFVVDLEVGTSTLLFESSSAFVVGAAAVADDGGLWVPDATVGLRSWRPAEGDTFTAGPILAIDGGGIGLPPRSVQRLVPVPPLEDL